MDNTHNNSLQSQYSESDLGDVVTTDGNGLPLSYVYSDEWDFSMERTVAFNRPCKVTFAGIPEDRRRAIQDALKSIYKENQTYSVGYLVAIRVGLARIADCLESHDWKLIDQEASYRKFKAALKNEALGRGSVENVVATVNALHDIGLISRLIHNGKSFIKKHCCPSKVNSKQSVAIPENMAKKMYKDAFEVVERYHPWRHEISQGYGLYFNELRAYKDEKGYSYNFKRNVGGKVKHGVPFDDFYLDGRTTCGSQIQTACLLVLLGFSGVRISEALSFNKSSYKEHSYGDIIVPTLTGAITKTQEGGVPKKETWVTHPIAKKALELAYDLSQFARDHYNDKYKDKPYMLGALNSSFLVLNIAHQTERIIISNFGRDLSGFLKAHNIFASEGDVVEFDLLNPEREGELKSGGFLPKLSPHDFRRTFAVFLVRNKLGNMMTLKHQYKHLNVIMTKWYANNYELVKALDLSVDSELKGLVNEANIGVTVDSLFEIYNSETLSGGKGERIAEERSKGDYAGSIYISRDEIDRQVRNGAVNVVEHPTGYCFKPDCSRICSSDRSSKTCQYEAITPDKARSRIPSRDRLIERFKALNDGRFYMANILTDMALKIEAIEQNLAAHNIEFTPFKAYIIANSIAYKELQ
ncbi:site-specific integrase [Halomonas colorata]|uniref:Site-specific integrase n=1 Tax=Halomonas colorata TaxID=2742615 RepID=A0ABR9G1R9_9GAMM|nr:site-specific integrase [Halomonas colorata]MBE0464865.1 site-specific integrase [Halomonas colorata]